MKYPIKILLYLLVAGVALAWSTPTKAQVTCGRAEISTILPTGGCEDKTVVLTEDLVCPAEEWGIKLLSDDECSLVFDCNGHELYGPGEGTGMPLVQIDADARHITVKNCVMNHSDLGITTANVGDCIISGNTFIDLIDSAIELYHDEGVAVHSNDFGSAAIISTYGQVTFYDNKIYPEKLKLDGRGTHVLYVEPYDGENIVGGPKIGGNAWEPSWLECPFGADGFCAAFAVVLPDGSELVDLYPLGNFTAEPSLSQRTEELALAIEAEFPTPSGSEQAIIETAKELNQAAVAIEVEKAKPEAEIQWAKVVLTNASKGSGQAKSLNKHLVAKEKHILAADADIVKQKFQAEKDNALLKITGP